MKKIAQGTLIGLGLVLTSVKRGPCPPCHPTTVMTYYKDGKKVFYQVGKSKYLSRINQEFHDLNTGKDFLVDSITIEAR